MGKTEVVTGHMVVTGCAGFIGSNLTDGLLADGHAMVGIDSFGDCCPRAIKGANLEGARANPAFALNEANTLELAAGSAPGGPEGGGVSGSAAALLRGYACVYHLTVEIPKVNYASSSSVFGDQDEAPLREGIVPRWT